MARGPDDWGALWLGGLMSGVWEALWLGGLMAGGPYGWGA